MPLIHEVDDLADQVDHFGASVVADLRHDILGCFAIGRMDCSPGCENILDRYE
jgi:hypothetical protein